VTDEACHTHTIKYSCYNQWKKVWSLFFAHSHVLCYSRTHGLFTGRCYEV